MKPIFSYGRPRENKGQKEAPLKFILLLAGLCTIAFSKPLHQSSASPMDGYFYSLPEQAGSPWGYQIPECSKLNAKEKALILHCAKVADHERCETRKQVQMIRADTGEKKNFNLTFFVFGTPLDCSKGRSLALSRQ
jgi:hypothetical protein